MAGLYWFRPMFEIVKGDWKWKIGPLLLTPGGRALMDESPSSLEIPDNSQWKMEVIYYTTRKLIRACHFKSVGERVNLVEPAALVKISILNPNVFGQMFPIWQQLNSEHSISPEEKVKMECQQADESWNYGNCLWNFLCNCLKFLSRLKLALPVYSGNPSNDDDFSDELFSELNLSEELFDNMQYSDVNFKIDGRELNRSPVCHFLPIKSLKLLLKYDN
jgi:hypothetical protein